MIGVRYWSTGITIKPDRWPNPERWTASLSFLDDGFCQADSTEGKLCLRYFVDELEVGLDTLRQDAERLGIVWYDPMTSRWAPDAPAAIYVPQDGEWTDGDHPDLRAFADAQARRMGWTPIYERIADAA